jgi:hypothetical protein
MKFILDIDGVLVHANPHRRVELEVDGFYKFNSIAVDALNSVINKHGDEVILSTSHRFRFSISEWKKIFKRRGLSITHISIIDLPLSYDRNRKAEIITWISTNDLRSDDLVIIDDDKSLNELPANLKERLVLTNSYVGLNACDDLERVVQRKKRRLINGYKRASPNS